MAETKNKIVANFGSGKGNKLNVLFSVDEKIEWFIDTEMDINFTGQSGEFDCSLACKKSIDKFMAGDSDQSGVNRAWKRVTNRPVSTLRVRAYLGTGGYSTTDYEGVFSNEAVVLWMNEKMNSNEIVQISFQIPEGGHASLVKRIRATQDFSKIRINLMNPGKGSRQLSSVTSIIEMFSISR